MPVSQRHQHRHYKTLIALVCCMTVGAFVLYGIDRAAPGARLRPLRSMSVAPQTPAWDRVAVRTLDPSSSPGFFHLRIDPQGRLFQSSAWRAALHESGNEGAIQVVVTRARSGDRVSDAQTSALTRVVDQLCREQRISRNQVVAGDGRAGIDRTADAGSSHLPELVRGI